MDVALISWDQLNFNFKWHLAGRPGPLPHSSHLNLQVAIFHIIDLSNAKLLLQPPPFKSHQNPASQKGQQTNAKWFLVNFDGVPVDYDSCSLDIVHTFITLRPGKYPFPTGFLYAMLCATIDTP